MSQLLYKSGEVVGAHFLEASERDWAQTCPPNTPVTLVAEPDNKYDPNAIIVMANGIQIGYIPADVSPMLSLFLQGGYIIEGIVTGRIGKRSRGNQKNNPSITLEGRLP
jgi:hypothetical protein